MDKKALHHLSYGLYLLTAREDGRDNGCIINTAIQAANSPDRLSVCVIKQNHTCGMIQRTGRFNVSAITDDAEFALFQRFGMQSGRDVDKFDGFEAVTRAQNGLYYLNGNANMYLSAKVTEQHDLGSHMLFVGEVTDAAVLSDRSPCTYAYYQSNIKPKPQKAQKKQWVCRICGHVYEGEQVPDDYICPLCSHGKEDFELVGEQRGSQTRKWVCTVCGYVHEGDEPPTECPICHVPAEKFKEQI